MNHAEPVVENYETMCCALSVENPLKRNALSAVMLLYCNPISTV